MGIGFSAKSVLWGLWVNCIAFITIIPYPCASAHWCLTLNFASKKQNNQPTNQTSKQTKKLWPICVSYSATVCGILLFRIQVKDEANCAHSHLIPPTQSNPRRLHQERTGYLPSSLCTHLRLAPVIRAPPFPRTPHPTNSRSKSSLVLCVSSFWILTAVDTLWTCFHSSYISILHNL